jgi:hypothetical protein
VKPLAIVATRTEMQGPAPLDLVEIAVLRIDPRDSQASDVFVGVVRSPRGTSPFDAGAMWLSDVMDRVRHLTRGCQLIAWHGAETRHYLEALCRDWHLLPLELAEGAIDVRSLTAPLVTIGEAHGDTLIDAAIAVGTSFKAGHVLEQVRAMAEIHRAIVRRFEFTQPLRALGEDERMILETIVRRVGTGRASYGEWRVDDGRKYPREALEELMDAMAYISAELVRLGKRGVA